MMYVDCFVAPVAKARRAEYTAFSHKAGAIYREHGALDLPFDGKRAIMGSFEDLFGKDAK